MNRTLATAGGRDPAGRLSGLFEGRDTDGEGSGDDGSEQAMQLPQGAPPEVVGILVGGSDGKPLAGEQALLCAITYSSEGKRLVGQSVDRTVSTDPLGRFQYVSVPPGTYSICARGVEAESADGEGPATVTVKNGDGRLNFGRLAVPGGRRATVKGTLVADDTKEPIVGRQVLLCPVTTDEQGVRSVQISLDFASNTDAQGNFQFTGVPQGPMA